MHGNRAQAVLAQSSATDWAQLYGSIPDWIVAFATLIGVAIAAWQLFRIAEANNNQVNIARAELMLEVDGRFESPEMMQSRIAIRTLRNFCEARTKSARRGVSDEIVAGESAKLFAEQVTDLYLRFKTPDRSPDSTDVLTLEPNDAAGEGYFRLMLLPYWMETVGMLTKRGLLPLTEVLDLYDAAFVGVLSGFEDHIRFRRSEGPNRNEKFLEHALWVKDQANLRINERAAAAANHGQPRRSTLFG